MFSKGFQRKFFFFVSHWAICCLAFELWFLTVDKRSGKNLKNNWKSLFVLKHVFASCKVSHEFAPEHLSHRMFSSCSFSIQTIRPPVIFRRPLILTHPPLFLFLSLYLSLFLSPSLILFLSLSFSLSHIPFFPFFFSLSLFLSFWQLLFFFYFLSLSRHTHESVT